MTPDGELWTVALASRHAASACGLKHDAWSRSTRRPAAICSGIGEMIIPGSIPVGGAATSASSMPRMSRNFVAASAHTLSVAKGVGPTVAVAGELGSCDGVVEHPTTSARKNHIAANRNACAMASILRTPILLAQRRSMSLVGRASGGGRVPKCSALDCDSSGLKVGSMQTAVAQRIRLLIALPLVLIGCGTTVFIDQDRWAARCSDTSGADCRGVGEVFVSNLARSGNAVQTESNGNIEVAPVDCPPLPDWTVLATCWRAFAPTTSVPRACMIIARPKLDQNGQFGQVGGDMFSGLPGDPDPGTTPC